MPVYIALASLGLGIYGAVAQAGAQADAKSFQEKALENQKNALAAQGIVTQKQKTLLENEIQLTQDALFNSKVSYS